MSHPREKKKTRTHDKVDPQVERVGRIEGRASSEPFRAKRHPSENASARASLSFSIGPAGGGHVVPAIKLGDVEHDDPVIPRWVALYDLVRDVRGEGSSTEHGQQFERDDRGVCDGPAYVGGGVFTPCICKALNGKKKIRK